MIGLGFLGSTAGIQLSREPFLNLRTTRSILGLLLSSIGLIIAFAFPRLCQYYGLIAGLWTAFAWIPNLWDSHHLQPYRFVMEPLMPFPLVNAYLSNFWIGWGLLVASRLTRSWLGFGMGALNVIFAVNGLGYTQFSSSFTLGTGITGLVLSSIFQFAYGISIIQQILAAWHKQAELDKQPKPPKTTGAWSKESSVSKRP